MTNLHSAKRTMNALLDSQTPDTSLGLSLSISTTPCKVSPPLSSAKAGAILQGFSHPASALLNFLSRAPPVYSNNKLEQDTGPQRSSHLAAQLELLPLKPCPQKLFSSPISAIRCQQPPVISCSSFSPGSSREIDVNHLPTSAQMDRDEISEITGILVKRPREKSCDAEPERTCEVVSSRGSDEEGDCGSSSRKKLRLSKDQAALLEESFKHHSTLNPKQKAELAKQLNLRPRQVEVWFQNRRARTKLKQTELDYELLKKCCESLTEENRRLQKEVQELRAVKTAPPCVIPRNRIMPVPDDNLSICPSCERVASHAASPPPSAQSSASLPLPASAISFRLSLTTPCPPQPHFIPLTFLAKHQNPTCALPSAAC